MGNCETWETLATGQNPLHLRMDGQRSDYYQRLPDKPIAKHFYNTPGHTFGCFCDDHRTVAIGWKYAMEVQGGLLDLHPSDS